MQYGGVRATNCLFVCLLLCKSLLIRIADLLLIAGGVNDQCIDQSRTL